MLLEHKCPIQKQENNFIVCLYVFFCLLFMKDMMLWKMVGNANFVDERMDLKRHILI
jgi:hypothetical protein